MFQMIAHGVSSAGMFFLVGVVYDRVHHRDLDRFGGLFQRMPVYAGISMVIFFAALGLPGLCGFIGEVLVVWAAWKYSMVLAVVAASVVILTAGYILWTIQRVYLGPEYKGPHPEALTPMTRREIGIAAPLVVLAVLLGVYPRTLLDYSTPTVSSLVQRLSDYGRRADAAAKHDRTTGDGRSDVGWVERSEPRHFRRTTDDGRRTAMLPPVARRPSSVAGPVGLVSARPTLPRAIDPLSQQSPAP